jgi:hypothetical protein
MTWLGLRMHSFFLQIHVNYMYIVLALAMSTIFEMRDTSNQLAALGRVLLTMAHGFWIIISGYVLYPPEGWRYLPWDKNAHGHEQIVWVSKLCSLDAIRISSRHCCDEQIGFCEIGVDRKKNSDKF